MRYAPCVRSGHCCKAATCAEGLRRGQPPRGCAYLSGKKPGQYWCALAALDASAASRMAIGEGCASTAFNLARRDAAQNILRGRLVRVLYLRSYMPS